MKILIVDDLTEMRVMLTMTLKRTGWEVIEAEDGQHAVELALQEDPDVILMDYNMPQLNGIDACQQIKQHPEMRRRVPVLIYTGAFAADVREAAVAAGADRFLIKPLLPRDLVRTVTEIYQNWQPE